MNKIFGPRAHLSATTIVKLMYRMSELIIIMGKYLGIYAKDSLDELLLITHHSSSYGTAFGRGKSREVERKAFSEWMDVNIKDERDTNIAKILGHMNQDGEWITDPKRTRPSNAVPNDVCWDSNDYNKNDLGDNFPYIKGDKPY